MTARTSFVIVNNRHLFRHSVLLISASPNWQRCVAIGLHNRMFVVGAYVARPRYATSEGCVG